MVCTRTRSMGIRRKTKDEMNAALGNWSHSQRN